MAACAADYWGKDYAVLVAAKQQSYSEMREEPYMRCNFGDVCPCFCDICSEHLSFCEDAGTLGLGLLYWGTLLSHIFNC